MQPPSLSPTQSPHLSPTPRPPSVTGKIGQPSPTLLPAGGPVVSGRIGTPQNNTTNSNKTNNTNNAATRNAAFTDTLDEPVAATIKRDLMTIYSKLKQVLLPRNRGDILKDWDLWGPLLLCLSLAISLSVVAPTNQSAQVFTGIFVLVWLGSVVVTVNGKLLGSKISFFQSICTLCYCISPLLIASIFALFISAWYLRIPLALGGCGWATWASIGFLGGDRVEPGRKVLVVYPVSLFYLSIAWIIMVSGSIIGSS